MKCKDCVCSDVCYYKAFNDVRAVKRRDDVEKVCKSFVNRDAVEVVRCKDCMYWDEYHIGSLDGPGMGDGACMENQHNWIDHRKADDFCSYGERKDND